MQQMDWIYAYNLFLFDLDGLLVDTEKIHFSAYVELCRRHGCALKWDYARYSEAAHHSATAIKEGIYQEFPELKEKYPDWKRLYEEKKSIFLQLLEKEEAPLMPGAKELLEALESAGIKRCVVTHSPRALATVLRKKNPILDSIPFWITREDYNNPKPDPECYKLAIERYGLPNEKVIGFEDSPRGIKALVGAIDKAVLVCPKESAYLEHILKSTPQVVYSSSLKAEDLNLVT